MVKQDEAGLLSCCNCVLIAAPECATAPAAQLGDTTPVAGETESAVESDPVGLTGLRPIRQWRRDRRSECLIINSSALIFQWVTRRHVRHQCSGRSAQVFPLQRCVGLPLPWRHASLSGSGPTRPVFRCRVKRRASLTLEVHPPGQAGGTSPVVGL